MKSINKISLEQRLQRAESCQSNFLAAFELPIDSYFYGWDEIIGYSCFSRVFEQEIRPYVPLCEERYFLCEAVHFAGSLLILEHLQMLYHILIEPFGKWEEQNGKETKP